MIQALVVPPHSKYALQVSVTRLLMKSQTSGSMKQTRIEDKVTREEYCYFGAYPYQDHLPF